MTRRTLVGASRVVEDSPERSTGKTLFFLVTIDSIESTRLGSCKNPYHGGSFDLSEFSHPKSPFATRVLLRDIFPSTPPTIAWTLDVTPSPEVTFFFTFFQYPKVNLLVKIFV